MKIRAKRPNGKWATLYKNLSEKKAKDILKDIYKNLSVNRVGVFLSPDGMKITGKFEYAVQE